MARDLGGLIGVALIAVGLLSLVWDSLRWGITPTPTSRQTRDATLDLMAEIGGGTRLYDLGSGWGGMACALARRFGNSRVVGIEGSRLASTISRLRPDGATVDWQCGDFLQADLHGCCGVYCYLYPGVMPQLAHKLRAELQPGSWIVSNTFALPGWTPWRIVRMNDLYRTPIYVYRCAA